MKRMLGLTDTKIELAYELAKQVNLRTACRTCGQISGQFVSSSASDRSRVRRVHDAGVRRR